MENNTPMKLNLDDKKVIETIKRTVAVGADEVELSMFLEFCKAAGLNPFKREAWFIKAGGRAQIMTGLNGYLKIANKHPQFDGMEIEIIEGQGGVEKAICKVHRKDRKYPSTGIALMREYKKGTPIWSQMPSVMLGKVAKCIAIREAFPLETEGTYTEEEMPPEFAASNQAPIPEAPKTVEVVPADELPTRAPEYFEYDLTRIEDIEQREVLVAWGTKVGCLYDPEQMRLKSKKQLKKLKTMEVYAPEGAESHV